MCTFFGEIYKKILHLLGVFWWKVGNSGHTNFKLNICFANEGEMMSLIDAKDFSEVINFSKEIKKGDKVITKSGIHGKIVELNDTDNTCVLETGAGKIKFERSALSLELSSKLNK